MGRAEEEREELERILHSPQFSKAPRLQKFLRVVCEHYFEGKAEQINEYLIGVEVFGKKADFHAAEDSIVRVEARELRRRLREYYQNSGRNSTLVLDLPVGAYVPRFVPCTNQVLARSLGARVALLPVWSRILIPLVAVVLLSFGFWRLAQVLRAKDNTMVTSALAGTSRDRPLAAFWDRFLAAQDPTIIVLSNPPVFRFLGPGDPVELRSKAITLPPSRDIAESLAEEIKEPGKLSVIPAPDQYTGIGEAMALYSIASALKGGNGKLYVKQSRTLSADDLKNHNLILLGGSAVNLWTGKLGQTLDFVGERGSVTNLRPQKAELSRYVISTFDQKTGNLANDYAVIAVERSSATGHWVLLLFGGHSEGTQAAAEAMTDELFLTDLLEKLGSSHRQTSSFPDSFQLLLSVKVNNGVPERPTYIAYHVP